MNVNETKNFSAFTKEDWEWITLASVSVVLFVTCLVISNLILPENCYLYELRQVGLLCDGIEIGKPNPPCPICRDERLATLARILFIAGFCFLILPFIVFVMKERRAKPLEQTKLFD
jgi:hypothetical protein